MRAAVSTMWLVIVIKKAKKQEVVGVGFVRREALLGSAFFWSVFFLRVFADGQVSSVTKKAKDSWQGEAKKEKKAKEEGEKKPVGGIKLLRRRCEPRESGLMKRREKAWPREGGLIKRREKAYRWHQVVEKVL